MARGRLILRQIVSALYVGSLSRWKHLGGLFQSCSLDVVLGAARSGEMGCITFDAPGLADQGRSRQIRAASHLDAFR